jgi:PAS domain S-box-containing protein
MDWDVKPNVYRPEPYSVKDVCLVVGSVAAASLARLFLSPVLGDVSPYLTYFVAIIVVSWLMGFRAGTATALLSAICVDYFFIPPVGSFHFSDKHQLSASIVFVIEGIAIAALGHMQRISRLQTESGAKAASEQALALLASEEHLRLATEGAGIGTWRWDVVGRELICSRSFKMLFGVAGESEVDNETFLAAVHPDDRERMRSEIIDAVQGNRSFDVELRVPWSDLTDHWLVVRGHSHRDLSDKAVRVEGIALDVTARKNAENDADSRAKRADALNRISKAIREMREPQEIEKIALSELATTLNVDRCLIILLDKKRDYVNFVAEWHRPDLPDLLGEYRLADFDVDLDEIFPGAAPLVVPDVEDSPSLSAKSAAMLRSIQIRSLLDIPMSHGGEIVSAIGAYMADTVRYWTPEDVSFVESIASQIRAAIDAARVLNEAENRANRESLINSIAEAIRTVSDPDAVQGIAVTMLGQALNADRCYFAIYDLVHSEVIIGSDWRRDDLPSVRGIHNFINTKEMFSELYPRDSVSVIVDRDTAGLSAQTIENMKGLQLRSRLSVAIADTKGMATLTAAMSGVAREWTDDDKELIKKAGALLRPSVEMARVQQREHRIATDLQAALIPALPSSIHGLDVGSCMQPALDEAEIGGDFYDAFAIDENRFALVVGDVSGKGLAAAAQLATVRNCLRMALYQTEEASEALASVNSVLTHHNLLVGFVTAFVGIFDAETGTLSYSSAGHEPALIYRTEQHIVETLISSGIPLGIVGTCEYTRHSTSLSLGDTLLLYTDGISEAGTSRSEMLETDGLIRIVGEIEAIDTASQFALDIVNKVRDYASGTFRDDVCVLTARRV